MRNLLQLRGLAIVVFLVCIFGAGGAALAFPVTQVFTGADNLDGDNTFDNLTSATANTDPGGTIEITDNGTYEDSADSLVGYTVIGTDAAGTTITGVNNESLSSDTTFENIYIPMSGDILFKLYTQNKTLTMRNCHIDGSSVLPNRAILQRQNTTLVLEDCIVEGLGRMVRQGATDSGDYEAYFTRCVFIDCGAGADQSFKWDKGTASNMTMSFVDCDFQGLTQGNVGPPIWIKPASSGNIDFTMEGCTFDMDLAENSLIVELEQANSATVSVTSTTAVNSAFIKRGFLSLDTNGSAAAEIANCVFDGFDPAIEVNGGVQLDVNHTTFVGLGDMKIAETAFSSAIDASNSSVTVTNSLAVGVGKFAQDGAGATIDVQDSVLMVGNAVFDGTWNSSTESNNLIVTEPSAVQLLSALADLSPNLSSTRDYNMVATSPAYGAAAPSAVTVDIEGTPRDASAPDAGAYEGPATFACEVASIDRGGNEPDVYGDVTTFTLSFSVGVTGVSALNLTVTELTGNLVGLSIDSVTELTPAIY